MRHLIRRTVTAEIGLAADFVSLQIRRIPLTRRQGHTTRTIQNPSRRAVNVERDEIRSVPIGTGTGQISSAAFRALDAMTNTRHKEWKPGVDRNQCGPSALLEPPNRIPHLARGNRACLIESGSIWRSKFVVIDVTQQSKDVMFRNEVTD